MWTAPLGKPVVPEVYMKKTGSSGSTAAARVARASSSTPPDAVSNSGHETAPECFSFETVITARISGRSGSAIAVPFAGKTTTSRTIFM